MRLCYNTFMSKVYVITGSTSGIGKALVEEYSKENVVFAGYRNENLKLSGNNIIPFYIDYVKPETINSAIEFIKTKTDKVDTIINAAGCVVAGAMDNISVSDLKRQFDVNVFGAIELTRGLDIKKIINISSMSSFGIYPFIAPYCASKRALDILFNLWGLECGKQVISLKLGAVATPIWSKSIKENEKSLNDISGYEKEYEYLIKNAMKNETKGIPVSKIVKKIIEIDAKQNPKPSYTIGFDAKVSELFSHLPQTLINHVIENKLKSMRKD